MKINEEQIRMKSNAERDSDARLAAEQAGYFGIESTPEEWEVKVMRSTSSSEQCTICILPITDKLKLAYYARGPWAHMMGMYIVSGIARSFFEPFGECDDGYCKHKINHASDLAAWLLPAVTRVRQSAPTAPNFASLVAEARSELEQWDQQIAGLPPDPPRAPARTLAHAGVLVPLIIVFMLIVVMIGAML